MLPVCVIRDMLTSLFACAFTPFPPKNYMYPQCVQTAIIIHLICSVRRVTKIIQNFWYRCVELFVVFCCQVSIYYFWCCVCTLSSTSFRVCTINVRQNNNYNPNNNCKLITSYNCCTKNLNTFNWQSDNNNEIECQCIPRTCISTQENPF